MKIKTICAGTWYIFNRIFEFFIPFGDLIVRLYLWKIFFYAGLSKFHNWEGTIYLFESEYQVPLLPAEWAAYMSTFVEIFFPMCLLLGLLGRLPAFVLSIYNVVAVVSYPALWLPEYIVGMNDHVQWGLMLLLLLVYGPSKLSLDFFISEIWKRTKS